MALEPLRVENLDDGKALAKVNEALRRIVRDVSERPDLATVRKVELVIGIKPIEHGAEGYTHLCPEIAYAVKHNIPAHVGNVMIGEVKLDSKGREVLLVNVDLPANHPGQRTIFDEQGETIEVIEETGEVL